MAAKSWKEVTEMYGTTTVVVRQEWVCPDVECQKIVAKELDSQRKEREAIRQRVGQRKAGMKQRRGELHLSKKR